ncbi:MAG: serine protease [Deltaproteobacteria bacterium]|nr:serine protease [Deltaproteobacteria bacterium]
MRSAFSVFLLLTLALVSTSFAADNAIRVDGEFWIGLDRTEPVAVTDEGVAEAVARAVVVAPEKSRAAVDAVLAAPNDEPLMIGAHVDIPAADLSRWVRAGDRWLLAVRSEGAFFLRPHFAEFPPEYSGRVLVRAPHDESAEAIVGHGTHDTWGPAVEGDTFVVEVRGESSVPSLVVDRVSHGFRAVEAPPTKEQNCHLDPNCYSEYVDQRAAVALIQFEVFSRLGALHRQPHRERRGGAWFYTANHCIGNQNAAASMIAYWEFETDVCNGAVPALASVPRTNGSDYVAGGSFYDYTLLKLHQDPPTGAFALGWTAEPLDPGENVAIIHHPSGAYKRLAFGFENGSSSQYWIIKYGEGNTEGGSSGSPLLNDENFSSAR